jgi:phosphoserine aminotransferase
MSLPYNRVHNFSAGPAVIPLPVIEELRETLPNLEGTGVGLMEISHRSSTFVGIFERARYRVKRVLGLPDDYTVLFLQGGASTQFLMLAWNLLQGGAADYLDTGAWSTKAIKEAKRFGEVRVPFSGKEGGYRAVPTSWERRGDAVYTHYTSNNTIYGTQYPEVPEVFDGMLVCDASSDIASRPQDYSRIDLLYAGAQKNLGPSGVTLVALSPRALERARACDAPTMLAYATHVDKDGMYNTPNTLGIWVLDRVLAWVEGQGLEAVGGRNAARAGRLYDLLDGSDFWRANAQTGSRSQMNVTWRLADPGLEAVLIKEATAAGLSGLKGHRSAGGLRASLYNALPDESVDALIDFLGEFERTRG